MAGCIVTPHSAAMASVEISHLCRSSITRSIYDIGVIVQMQSRPIRIGGLRSIVQSSSMFRHLYWYTEPSNLFLMHPFFAAPYEVNQIWFDHRATRAFKALSFFRVSSRLAAEEHLGDVEHVHVLSSFRARHPVSHHVQTKRAAGREGARSRRERFLGPQNGNAL